MRSVLSRLAPSWRRLRRDRAGSALMELALGAPVLIAVVVGVFEISLLMFANVLLEGGVRAASRYGITGREVGGMSREEQIAQIIRDESYGLLDVKITSIETSVYDSFDAIGSGEAYQDVNASGFYDAGEPFQDANANGIYDAEPGTPGAGQGDEIVLYRVAAEWQTFTPFIGHLLGDNGRVPLAATVAVQNEPFDPEDEN